MNNQQTTAVMGGAREAHEVIAGLRAAGLPVTVSLPEPERSFGPLPIPARIGAFGDAKDVRDWFAGQDAVAVIDASHAFDHRLSAAARRAARAQGLPYLRLLRPAWRASPGDAWVHFDCLREAIATLAPGARVFSTTGWASLCDYAGFRGEVVFMRQTQAAGQPSGYRFIRFVSGRPPFSCQQEEHLFRQLGVSVLICRNFGGAASMSKLEAARKLGLRVLMIDRPALPAGVAVVPDVAGALTWRTGL